MKSILVLEGGAMRGIYTAGILDELMKNNITVDAIVGVSAGALFGVNYKSHQIGRCLKYNLEYAKDKNYMGFYSFIKTGNIMNKETCFKTIIYDSHPFDFETYKKSKTKFYAVVTNVETGIPEYIEIKDVEQDVEYLRASGSMPIVSQIVEINHKKYLDGAIGDSIPIHWAEQEEYDKIIVIETRPKDFRKKKVKSNIARMIYRKYPKFIESFYNRYQMYNEEKEYIEKQAEKGKILVLRPSKLIKIKRIEKNRDIIQKMYNLGVEDYKEKEKEIKEYLEIKE